MLADAVLMKILHNNPDALLRGFLTVCAIVGILASFAPSLFFRLLENTPKAKARNRRDLNAELQRKYEAVCARIIEVSADYDTVVKENIRLVGLLREEHSHNRDWDIRARRELDERKEAAR